VASTAFAARVAIRVDAPEDAAAAVGAAVPRLPTVSRKKSLSLYSNAPSFQERRVDYVLVSSTRAKNQELLHLSVNEPTQLASRRRIRLRQLAEGRNCCPRGPGQKLVSVVQHDGESSVEAKQELGHSCHVLYKARQLVKFPRDCKSELCDIFDVFLRKPGGRVGRLQLHLDEDVRLFVCLLSARGCGLDHLGAAAHLRLKILPLCQNMTFF
jgi:hypothetical protein